MSFTLVLMFHAIFLSCSFLLPSAGTVSTSRRVTKQRDGAPKFSPEEFCVKDVGEEEDGPSTAAADNGTPRHLAGGPTRS